MNLRSLVAFSLLLVSRFLFCSSLPAQDEGLDDLDQQLLGDLDSELLEGLDDLPPIPKPTRSPDGGKGSGGKTPDTRDSEPGEPKAEDEPGALDQLGIGEDIGTGATEDPLSRIGGKMRTVEELITEHRTNDRTQRLQTEILEDLAVLIEIQKKKCQSSGSGQKKTDAKKQGQPQEGNSQAPGDGPEKSTSRLGQEDVSDVAERDRQEFLKQLWGNLPERFLQQIENAGNEKFLPKYEQLIEEYYKRLAEEGSSLP